MSTPLYPPAENVRSATDSSPLNPVGRRVASIDLADMSRWLRLIIFGSAIFIVIGLIALAIRLAMSIHHTILLFALGALVAYALDPLVERLRHPIHGKHADITKGLSRKASVAIVFVCILAILGLGIWALGAEIAKQAMAIRTDFPLYHARAMTFAGHMDTQLAARHVKFSLTQTMQHPPRELTAFGEKAGRQLLPILEHTFASAAESIIVLLIALYFLLFSQELKETTNKNLPPDLLMHVVPWQADVNRILGGFVRGQLVIALLTGAFAAVGCLLIGIHLWLIIGLFVVVAALIPVFGPYIGAIPAIIAALVGPTHIHNPIAAAVAVLVLFIVLNEGGSKVLYPKLVGQALGLHELVVLFVLFAGLELDGVIGTLFAAPIAALSIVTIIHLYRYWQGLADSVLANVAKREGEKAQA